MLRLTRKRMYALIPLISCLCLLSMVKLYFHEHDSKKRVYDSGDKNTSKALLRQLHPSVQETPRKKTLLPVEPSPETSTVKVLQKPTIPTLTSRLEHGQASSFVRGPSSSNNSKPRVPIRPRTTTQGDFLLREQVKYPHNFAYIHNLPTICVGRDIEVIITVPSAVDNFHRRQRVRRSNLRRYQNAKENKQKTLLLFFLGDLPGNSVNAAAVRAKVEQESRLYRDIVQENFTDVYNNIRLKAVQMLKWASEFCPAAEFVLRVDDDMVVVPDLLVTVMRRLKAEKQDFIVGQSADGWEPLRDKRSKYYLSFDEYQLRTLPPFLLGGVLGYPLSTVKMLYQASLRLKPIWLDDVYITGMCADVMNVARVTDPKFTAKHGAPFP